MGSELVETTEISVIDFDRSEMQGRLVKHKGQVMTVEEWGECCGENKHKRVRQQAVAMKHLYAAIRNSDVPKTRQQYMKLSDKLGTDHVLEQLKFHALLEAFNKLWADE